MKAKQMLVCIALLLVAAGARAQDFAGGDGTANSPYLIRTAAQLDNVRKYEDVAHKDKHFRLDADIQLSDYAREAYGTPGWDPIGGWDPILKKYIPFCGSFDGNNHTIYGLWANRGQIDYVGLFGVVSSGGSIKNLTLTIDNSRGGVKGNNYTGGLLGAMEVVKELVNCHVTGGSISGSNYTGGVAGGMINNGDLGQMKNCHTDCDVSAIGTHTGGLAGSIATKGNGEIAGCYATGAVTSSLTSSSSSSSFSSYVGGLTGSLSGFNVTGCYATGAVNSSSDSYSYSYSYVGGLIGSFSGLNITDCYANGAVNFSFSSYRGSYSYSYVGGLTGSFSGLNITGCYANGAVNSSSYIHHISYSYVGGLTGYLSGLNITGCYATGAVNSSSDSDYDHDSYSSVGGLTGKAVDITMTNCYAIGAVSSTNTYTYTNSRYYVDGYYYCGGLTGEVSTSASGKQLRINDCYATGNVKGTTTISSGGSFRDDSRLAVGGLTGIASPYSSSIAGDVSITNCYASGTVSGTTEKIPYRFGGIAGKKANNAAIFNCYFLKTAAVSGGIGEGVDDGNTPGLTDSEMRQRSSFPGFFNAASLWEIREGISYPYLRGIGSHIPTHTEAPAASVAVTLHASGTGDGRLHIGGLTPGERFAVYTIGGQQVFYGRAEDSRQTVVVPTTGVHIVVSGGESVKVVVGR